MYQDGNKNGECVKITETKTIKDCEQELIDAITGDLDWDNIEKILREKHRLDLTDDIEFRKGDIIVHNNQIAYKIDFDIKVSVSVLFNRKGDCLDLNADPDQNELTGDESDENEGISDL